MGTSRTRFTRDTTAVVESYEGTIRNERGFGQVRLVAAAPLRAHLAELLAFGMSMQSIGALAGLDPSTIYHIRKGQPLCKDWVARAVLSVEKCIADETHREGEIPLVPRLGIRRRLEALMALGWPLPELDARYGGDTGAVRRGGLKASLTTHQRIAALYDELSMTPGPSTKARTWAAKRGFAPPMAWDDIDLDDAPNVNGWAEDETPVVDEVAIARALAGDRTAHLERADREEALRRHLAEGGTNTSFERLTGVRASRYTDKEQAA